ncbi:sensor histidine kinase [Tahibacter amnicola]|uniref:histidine kinase n=1 Tax=Tahibacter amnicola TaxID=2976241 RepID=A0ABY6BGV4_9GAMM|nr:ATP-binding protein [Tahibacter amnicola]UXI69075.1 ATP-binding protein [Tahibacter amnicola]
MNASPLPARHSVPTPDLSPDLTQLQQPVEPLTPRCTVQQAGERFREPRHAALLSLPVVERGKVLGCITRHDLLMRVYMHPYGRELHGRRSVATIMNADPVILPVNTPIEAAGKIIGARIRRPITEDFAIVDADGTYRGMGIVLDVLHALETRLGEHSRELERACRHLQSSQNQLIQSEKLATLGQLVAGLAHEINTPLGYVQNNVEMIRPLLQAAAEWVGAAQALMQIGEDAGLAVAEACVERMAEASQAFEPTLFRDIDVLLEDTLHGVTQMADLVGNLKDFSRIDQRRSDDVDLHGVIDAALRIGGHLLRKRQVDVRRHYGELPLVRCAPAQINQVLLNLITNAAQAIDHDKGVIAIRTQALGGYAMIAVHDNGRGIAPDVLPRIFEPFFTTKPTGQGTGLGLSICQQIIHAHGGRIAATSSAQAGTRFVVALPLGGRPPGSPA